jgi:hypothetical protein
MIRSPPRRDGSLPRVGPAQVRESYDVLGEMFNPERQARC